MNNEDFKNILAGINKKTTDKKPTNVIRMPEKEEKEPTTENMSLLLLMQSMKEEIEKFHVRDSEQTKMLRLMREEIASLKVNNQNTDSEQITWDWSEVFKITLHKYINPDDRKFQVLFVGKNHDPEKKKVRIVNGKTISNGKPDLTLVSFTGKFDDNKRSMYRWVRSAIQHIDCYDEFTNPIQICCTDKSQFRDGRIAIITEINSNLVVLLIKRGNKVLINYTYEMEPDKNKEHKFYRVFHKRDFTWVDLDQ